MKQLPFADAVEHLENSRSLDPLVGKVKSLVDTLIRPQQLRDILHGVPLGHPLHPAAVQIPLGAWLSAAVLDAIPHTERAARTLIGLGVISAIPSAAAGYTDWSKLHRQQQRVGLIHSAANLTATCLYAASYLQRRRGRHTSGKALAYAAFAIAMGSGYLGGQLVYRQASGVNHTEDIAHRFPDGWQSIGALADIPPGMNQVLLGETSVLVFRRGNVISALSDVCSHLGGPLHEGEITEEYGPCVVCPWHGSTFALQTGEVVHGPATARLPKLLTRVAGGMVEIRFAEDAIAR